MAKGGNNGKIEGKAPKWRGYAADPEVQAFVVGQVRDGQTSAPAIKRLLDEELGRSPSERTLQKMVKWASVTPAEPWTLADADRDEIALITPVWAVALGEGGRLTKGAADWIVRVRTAAPDLPPDDVWAMALLYVTDGLFVTEGLRDALDAVIAFAPWRSKDHAERYFTAANSGRIPSPLIVREMATRAFKKDDRQPTVRDYRQTNAFLESQPNVPDIYLNDSTTIVVGPERRKEGRDE